MKISENLNPIISGNLPFPIHACTPILHPSANSARGGCKMPATPVHQLSPNRPQINRIPTQKACLARYPSVLGLVSDADPGKLGVTMSFPRA